MKINKNEFNFYEKEKNKSILYDNVLIYDIETDGVDTKTSKLKWFGAYSYKDKAYYNLDATDKEQFQLIQELIKSHKVLVGYNSYFFDKPIMQRNGISWGQYKIDIDLMKILTTKTGKGNCARSMYMSSKNGSPLAETLDNYKLSSVCKAVGFDVVKGDIDYNIFKKNKWSYDEIKDIKKYLQADIELTKQLFEYTIEQFEYFKEYISYDDYRLYKHIRTPIGLFSYMAMMYMAGVMLEFETDEDILTQKPINHGGYVLEPQKEFAEDVVYFDFTSLYPMIFIQNNLFTSTCKCCKKSERVSKCDLWELKGSYCGKTQGVFENLYKKIYQDRKEYKQQGDPRQYALKIILNSFYGSTGVPRRKNIYNYNVSGDCTIIGRAITKFSIDYFNKKGFKVVYADTDSCFIELGDRSEEESQKVADEIVFEIQKRMIFPYEDFKFKVDGRFKKIRFKGKKHYYGIDYENNVTKKGISLVRKDVNNLTKIVYTKLEEEIIKSKNLQLPKNVFDKTIKSILDENINVISKTFNVKNEKEYDSKTSIHYQISKVFGEGSHNLIPNTKLGKVGKSTLYCTIKQSKFLKFEDLKLNNVYNELNLFYY